MVFSVTYIICKGLKIGVYSSSATSANCEYVIIVKISKFLKCKIIYIMTFRVSHWNALDDSLHYKKLSLSIQMASVRWLY